MCLFFFNSRSYSGKIIYRVAEALEIKHEQEHGQDVGKAMGLCLRPRSHVDIDLLPCETEQDHNRVIAWGLAYIPIKL